MNRNTYTETEKTLTLSAETIDMYIDWLSNGEEGDFAGYKHNGTREVVIENLSGGRYALYGEGGYLNATDDVFKAVWFLKTGEYIAPNGKMAIANGSYSF